MKKIFAVAIAIVTALIPLHLFAGDYEKAWVSLFQNDKKKATEFFRKAVKSNDNRDNAISMLIILEGYMGYNYADKYPPAIDQFNHPDPYLYTLWFNEAILGEYGKKQGKQLGTLDKILTSPGVHGSLKAAAHYFKGLTMNISQRPADARTIFNKIGALQSWQFTGPFDNVNGSGFNKDYGPLKEPSSTGGFLSSQNNTVNWFTPLHSTNQGWIFVNPFFTESTAIGYAQTFVYSPEEQDVVLCLGGYGSFKAWVNDKLLLSRPESNKTELDAYQVKCHLNQGYNRILVQIGYTADVKNSNFIVRLTDPKCNPIGNIKSNPVPQKYIIDKSKDEPAERNHFAEEYFLSQLKKSPKDPAIPFLLSKVYIRNQEFEKAKSVMNDLYKKYPDNPFVVNYYADCLSRQFENTQIAELVEKVKLLDPENYWVLLINENKSEEEKKFDEAGALLDKMESIGGKTLLTELKRVNILAQSGKIDSGIALLKKLYEKEHQNSVIVNVMAQIYKHALKQPDMYLKVLEDFAKDNSDITLNKTLSDEYFEKNESEKGLQVLRNIVAIAPYDPEVYSYPVQYFYAKQQYDSSIYYLNQISGISPYNHSTLADIANCYLQKNDIRNALSYYRKALSLFSGGYEYRRRIRELEKKQDLFKYFPESDFYSTIKNDFKKPFDTSHAYYYVSEERNVIVYKEGASEQVYSAAIKVNNKNGIDAWKETSIPYNSYYQNVQILKAEVIKESGARVPAETSGSDIVFTKLEEGDAIYYSYKISNHGVGRLAKEFWDKFYFNSTVPAKETKYSIMIDEELPLYFQVINDERFKPTEGKKENFRMYSWAYKNLPAIRDESYMPRLEDIGKVLHITTVKSWDVIAEWYSDITRMQSREDFELNQAFHTIFPNGVNGLTDKEKALKIYEYIEANIAYSSVSFRQSAYVPQRAGKTLQTRLGDCKDLSTLFLSFARKAGLDANLVLVSTRNNGLMNVVLPSMDFNHCIIRYKDGVQYKYLELTDSQLPFCTLTSSMANAQILNILYEYKAGEVITSLPVDKREKVAYLRIVKMTVKENDLRVTTVLKSSGELARDMRANYENKTRDESKDALQQQLSGAFKNPVQLNRFDFKDLNNLRDTVVQELDFTVSNDVINVGDLSMLKPVMIEVVASAGIFTDEKREYPFEYSNYENADKYRTVIEVELPAGKAFEQVPADVKGNFMHMQYSLNYKKAAPNKLTIERVFETDRTKRLSAGDFEKMKDFFSRIISAEQKYISFK